MTKRELIEMLSEVPDNATIKITESRNDLLAGTSICTANINGYYEHMGVYILCSLSVRPYKREKHDQN